MAFEIDLNADMGESFGAWSMGADADLLACVSSANVACGFHAGDPRVMERTVGLAVRAGVAVGAHPGFADLRGFGRRPSASRTAATTPTAPCSRGGFQVPSSWTLTWPPPRRCASPGRAGCRARTERTSRYAPIPWACTVTVRGPWRSHARCAARWTRR